MKSVGVQYMEVGKKWKVNISEFEGTAKAPKNTPK